MGKKLWPASATRKYVAEIHNLIALLKEFKKRWRDYASSHDEPKGPQSDMISDAEMDLNDCMDSFMGE